MPYEPIIPEGQHLGTSREVDGAVTGHLFEDGTNELKGHAAWRRVDEPQQSYPPSYDCVPPYELTPEEREFAEQLAARILIGIVIAIDAAAPHIKRWWDGRAAPAVASTWKRVTALRKANSKAAAGTASSVSCAALVASANGAGDVRSSISMTSFEWEHRFRAMLTARAFAEQQYRLLCDARIEDSDVAVEARSTIEQLISQHAADRLKPMYETSPSLLDGETLAELVRVLNARPEPSNDQSKPELEQ